MVLDATTDSLEIILDKSVTTNQLSFSVFYNEYTSTTVTPFSNYGTTNNTTAVNLIPSPVANRQRQLRWCSINNVDTADIGVKIRFNNNGTFRTVLTVFLRVGESIQYSEEMGWRVYTNSGYEKVVGYQKFFPTIRMAENFGAAGAATTLTLVSGTSYCIYLGRADRVYSSVKFQYNVTTLTSTITWAELAVYRGTPTIQTNVSLTRLGFTDTSAVWNSTGIKTTTVTTTGMAIGDDLWAVYSNSATTPAAFRAGAADELGAGFVQTVAATRPSTNSSISPTISTTVANIWTAWQGIPQGT